MTRPSVAERFWSRVDKSGGPDACWPWTAGANYYGYGALWVGGRMVPAHRVAYELTIGPIPEGQEVLHRCDNPVCCNSGHHFLGTQLDNMVDRDIKGRTRWHPRCGAQAGRAKLTDVDVHTIRQLGSTMSCAAIARRYKVSATNVWNILHRVSWQHLPEGGDSGN